MRTLDVFALVEENLGRELALRVAQMMVVFLRRPGGQSQISATLEAQTRERRPLGGVGDEVLLDDSLSYVERAVAVGVPPIRRSMRSAVFWPIA